MRGFGTVAGAASVKDRVRRIAATLLVGALGTSGTAVGMAAIGVEQAGAAATYQVTASPSLSARTGPGTGYSVVRYLAYGTSVSIVCQVQGGTNINGNATWNKLADGTYVSDYWMNTPSFNSYIPGMPACGSTTTTTTTTIPGAESAISWAYARRGSTAYEGWCLKFVANAYGRSAAGFASAKAHWNNAVSTGRARYTSSPPRGALVFWNSWFNGVNYGHVGISLGGGQVIATSVGGKVGVASLSYFSNYLGWVVPYWG